MATLGNYFIDTESFVTATAVWTDATFNTKAVDGWYQSCGVYRRQLAGFLQPPESCLVCELRCFPFSPCASLGASFVGDFTVDVVSINTGAGTGAVKVVLRTGAIGLPVAAFVTYDGNTYSEVVSANFGFLAGPWVGDIATFAPYGFPGGSPYLLADYNWGGVSCIDFVPAGSASTILITGSDGVAGAPGALVMFIPKPNGDPRTMHIRVSVPVGGTEAAWDISNECVAPLSPRAASGMVASSVLACAEPFTTFIFNGPVNGTAGILGLYDLVYVDENATVKLVDVSGAGFYKWQRPIPFATDGWFEIDANSVIISFGNCP